MKAGPIRGMAYAFALELLGAVALVAAAMSIFAVPYGLGALLGWICS